MNVFQGLGLSRTAPFTHNGKNYEVRVFSDGHNMVSKVFIGGHEANGYSHSVTLPVAFDLKRQTGIEPIEKLICLAKQDVVEERWEKVLAFFAEELKRQKKPSKKT